MPRLIPVGLALPGLLLSHPAPTLAQAAERLPTRLVTVSGLDIPESARYDPDQDFYFVSNVGAHATARDNNGAIAIIDPDGRILDRTFIAGGRNGVVLHAPKGMALRGDQLWVTDVTVIRAFHRRTGAPLATVDFAPLGPRFLNDIAVGPDGSLYVTDTGLEFGERVTRPGPDRVYRVAPNGTPEILVDDGRLEGPNGVFWDTDANRLLIASIGGRNVLRWTAADGVVQVATGPGGYDGIERLPDGRIVVSSQMAQGVMVLQGATLQLLFDGVPNTGDIGVDSRRNRVAIPRLDANVMEIWQLP